MDEQRDPRDRVWLDVAVFVVVTAAMTAPFWWLQIAHRRDLPANEVGLGLMWAPAGAAIVMRRFVTREVDLGLRWPARRYLLIAQAIPASYIVLTYAGGAMTGIVDAFTADNLAACESTYKLGLGGAGSALVAILWGVTVQLLWNLLYALGEELGWRGYLVPVLSRRLGLLGTGLVSGVIWAAWHFPLFTKMPVVELVRFTIFVTSAGVICAWLRLRSRSVWPAVMFHGVHNTLLGVAYLVVEDRTGWYGDEGGIAFGLSALVIASVLVMRDRRDATSR